MKPHHLPPTTHTIEMAQIAEFNTRLEAHQGPALTAAELGLEGAPLHRRSTSVLPGTAELIRVAWDGAPEFPDVHAHFAPTVPGASDAVSSTCIPPRYDYSATASACTMSGASGTSEKRSGR